LLEKDVFHDLLTQEVEHSINVTHLLSCTAIV
jgi:hypothetical protein